MTQKDRDLLLKDLCARLPYGVKCYIEFDDGKIFKERTLTPIMIQDFKRTSTSFIPYLRPMSSMIEEEKEEIKPLFSKFTDEFGKRVLVVRQNKMALYQDWLNRNHFYYRGLIPMGLAIEVTEENNPYK